MAGESKDALVEAPAALIVVAALSATAESRQNIATQHLWTARSAAKRCGELELRLVSEGKRDVCIEHRSLAMTAVLFSASFLEALVNQLFADAAETKRGQRTHLLSGLAEDDIEILAAWWLKTNKDGKQVNERKAALPKYQEALNQLGKPRLVMASDPYLSADHLMELRHALVHFKPEWQGSGSHPIEKMLTEHPRFVENQQAIGTPWYPNKCLGAGCAVWACAVAMDFADAWCARMGLTYDYKDDFRGWPPV